MVAERTKELVDLRKFKSLAKRKVPHESPLYKVVASEQDELTVDSFLSKSEIWLRLIDIAFLGES